MYVHASRGKSPDVHFTTKPSSYIFLHSSLLGKVMLICPHALRTNDSVLVYVKWSDLNNMPSFCHCLAPG